MSLKKNQKDSAYDFIKSKILSCEYLPGEMINAQQMCDEMGAISRTPIRDALSVLEQEGLVTVLPKKGIIVTNVNLKDINHVFEVRVLLETYTLKSFGTYINQDDLKDLFHRLSDDTSPAVNAETYYALDDKLHNCIMDALANPFLRSTYKNIMTLNSRFRIMTGNTVVNRMDESKAEHLTILSNCLDQDWNQAASSMRTHLENARKATILLMAETDAFR